ncbi:MAG: VCBS repeat-containing protein [Rhodothermales bacterium]
MTILLLFSTGPPRAGADRDGLTPASIRHAAVASHMYTKAACAGCHDDSDGFVDSPDHVLNRRSELDPPAWADSARVQSKCGTCHLVPDPSDLPPGRWDDALVNYMSKVMYYLQEAPDFSVAPVGMPYAEWMAQTRDEWMDVLHYYLAFSSSDTLLPPDPAVSGLRFEHTSIGRPPGTRGRPQVGNVNVVDLDGDGRKDVVVGDFERHRVSLVRREENGWREHDLASIPYPGHTEVGDFDGDGDSDIVVANVGSAVPTDNRVGSVVLLTRMEGLNFESTTILEGVGRVADVRPGDFDQDGDVDFVVAIFGFLNEGGIGWLERQADGSYRYHPLSDKQGGVNVLPTDLNGDGRLDFIALISQQYEEITAFVNQGGGRFTEQLLFKADSPTFGSSGIELVDLDRDGDVDVLFTNGDGFDLSSSMIRPYHGVQWLENEGEYRFRYHDLLRLYGAYRAVPGDLDGDGDLDIIATSLLNDWSDPERMSLIWLENDGRQHFTPHGIGNTPASIITADVADLDGDGRLDIVTGSMPMSASDPRQGRVTVFSNLGPLD